MPIRKLLSTAAFMLAMATLTACDAGPLAPRSSPPATAAASTNIISRDEATVPFNFAMYASCANGGQGETLGAIGSMQYRGHWISTTQGTRQHNVIVTRFTGTATGDDTGDVYDITTREISQSNNAYGTDGILDSGEELQRVSLLLTNRATGASFTIVLTGRFVQTPAGDYVLDGWTGTARC